MEVHLLTPAADLRLVRVVCGAPDVHQASWLRSQVTCPQCLAMSRDPCLCGPGSPACAACQRWHQGQAQRRVLGIENEKAFQERVRSLALAGQWRYFHCHDARKSPDGFPDTVCVRIAASTQGARLLFAELKMPGNRPTEAQRQWLAALGQVTGPPEVYLWTPADLAAVEEVLR